MNSREPFNHKWHRESQAPKVTRRQQEKDLVIISTASPATGHLL